MLKKAFSVCLQNVKALYIQCCMYDVRPFITFIAFKNLQEINELYTAKPAQISPESAVS